MNDIVDKSLTFMGFRRPDGLVGIRNHILVVPTVYCLNSVTEKACRSFISHYGNNCSVVPLANPHGCAMSSEDHKILENILIGTIKNPNVFGVVIVHMEEREFISAKKLIETGFSHHKDVQIVGVPSLGNAVKINDTIISAIKKLAESASLCSRTPCSIEELTVGLKCGGSDFSSGVVTNHVLGNISDLIVQYGGVSIIGEIPEFIGAEEFYAERAVNMRVKEDILRAIQEFEADLIKAGVDFRGVQPIPANIAGGITTIEEKSLGAIHKSGSSYVQGVLSYGEIPTDKGHFLMSSPSHDSITLSAFAAAGAQVILFSTGQGAVVGNAIVPVMKVNANREIAERMVSYTDVDISGVIKGENSIEDATRRTISTLLDVCEGKLSCTEVTGNMEFGVWLKGPIF